MAKVVVIFNGQVQKELSIDRARMNIGRRPGNDLVLDHLAVSGRHAAIDTTSEGTFILDLGSTNGTSVNGQPIKKHLLQNDDVIELGKYQLKFVVEVDNYQISPDETLKVGKIKVLNGGNSKIKSHNCVRNRSFYDYSRSCGIAKNPWILAQLKLEFYFLVRPISSIEQMNKQFPSTFAQNLLFLKPSILPT